MAMHDEIILSESSSPSLPLPPYDPYDQIMVFFELFVRIKQLSVCVCVCVGLPLLSAHLLSLKPTTK